MPQPQTQLITPGQWHLVTPEDATTIMFQNVGAAPFFVQGTVGATPPATLVGGWKYDPPLGQPLASLAELFPGVTGANRVYIRSLQETQVEVQYA